MVRESETSAPGNSSEFDARASALDGAELALLAQQYLAVGSFREALALSTRPEHAQSRGLRLCAARAHFGLGDRQLALQLLNGLLDEQPRDGLVAFCKAQLLAHAAEPAGAKASLRQLLALTPDFPGALPLLAQLELPGPPYREVLRRVHARLRPDTYLEIGVESGATLQLARHSRAVLGVDPVARPIPYELPAGTRLFNETSDQFFARERASLLGSGRLDLCFIDGMHWYEFALRDFHNAERWCKPGSLILLHDCLAAHRVAALRRRRTSFWVGDTWRALEWLVSRRPDLNVAVIPCYPSGLVAISNLNPEADSPSWAMESAATEAEQHPPDPSEWPTHYRLVENSAAGVERWLDSLGPPSNLPSVGA
jgi:tetratricopeptide (TPR) repeat protein